MKWGRDALGNFDAVCGREWLVTNGIGGFAAGTVGGANTRRYHGLLIASLRPPVERVLMVSKLDVMVRHAGVSTLLSTNEYADGTIHPRGFCHLDSFRLEGLIPVWSWVIGDALLEQRVWMEQGSNTTYVAFELVRASGPVELEAQPLCAYRDYHAQQRGQYDIQVQGVTNGVAMTAYAGARPVRLLYERGDAQLAPEWHWNLKHREETCRGLDDLEDLFRPAILRMQLRQGESAAWILTAEAGDPRKSKDAYLLERKRQRQLTTRAGGRVPGAAEPEWIQQLRLAADQFLVERRDAQGNVLGQSVIAGFPWFSDWGRDTMIALPGLTLTTGRTGIAASILRTFARFVSEGMLPNRFPDSGDVPEYNTVDATLWFFVAVDEYLRRTGDDRLGAELFPVLKQIIDAHVRGTRYGIEVDAADGLLFAGEPGVQLTWMDAKVGDWVVTPRLGKCVEINALWFNALTILANLAARLHEPAAAADLLLRARAVRDSFNERFWSDSGYLYDVIDGPDGPDSSLRPNQIFAVSLRHGLLDADRAQAVVDTCAKHLWTPVGLRSLASTDPRFVGSYGGGPLQRDGAYHQGTVWSWLLGPFALAHYRVHADAAVARAWLSGMEAHLREACVGQISEIFDGDAPFTSRGCFAQAWGVAETLRIWSEINECELEAARAQAG